MPFILTVMDNDGEQDFVSHLTCHSTEKRARDYLAAWCRGQWEDQGQDEPLPQHTDPAIKRFFDFWSDSGMSWEITDTDIAPDPADVDHSAGFALGESSVDEGE